MVHISNTPDFENNDNIFMAARYTYIPTTVQADGKLGHPQKSVEIQRRRHRHLSRGRPVG